MGRPIILALAAAALLALTANVRAELRYVGVNLAGAEFGEANLPGTFGVDYTYPTFGEVNHFLSRGMNTFRVPFMWERLQLGLGDPLSVAELGRLDTFVNYATGLGAHVILDVHNFGAYHGAVINAPVSGVSAADFADLWSRLATHYAGNDRVIFGLMNEPVGIDNGGGRPGGTTEAWLGSANAAFGAIRSAGAGNLILVPGNGYTGAWSWNLNFYGTPNATVMGGIFDPLGNFAYEVHQYLDADSSGRTTEIVSPTIGPERLAGFTDWLRANNARGFLGEFGVGPDALGLTAMDNLLANVHANADVWLGWTYWAAGPWWGDYAFSVEPDLLGNDKPQMAILETYAATVPEPGPLTLLGVAALALAGFARKRRPTLRPAP